MAGEKNSTQSSELIVQTPHIVRLAQGIDVSQSPQLAGEVERDAFVHLSRWINNIIHVKVAPDTLRATVGAIPGLGTAFAAYDLICDIVDLGTFDEARKEWGYKVIPNWVTTTIDVVGFVPVMGGAVKGFKPAMRMMLDPKFQLHHIRDHLAAIGQGQALVWMEEMVESKLPTWTPKINDELKASVNGLQSNLNQLAQRPGVKLANSVFGMFGASPVERVNGLLNDVKRHGPEFIDITMKGGKNFPGIITLGKRVLTKGRSQGAVSGNQKARTAPKGESETKAVPRNATTGETNTSHRPQNEQYATRHKAGAGPQQERAPRDDCGCQRTGPGGKPATSKKPVHFATGEEILYHTDFTAPGLVPVDFTRCYRSSHAPYDDSLLGARWTSPYTTSITQHDDGLIYHDFMGRNVPLPNVAIGKSHDEAFESFTLRRLSEHTLVLVYRNGDVDLFQSEGANHYGYHGKQPRRYFLREKQTKAGPILFILPAHEAYGRFRHHPYAALLSPEALLVITDGQSLWLECMPAKEDSLIAASPAARAAISDLAAVHAADQKAGLAVIGSSAHHNNHLIQLPHRIGTIEQILADGTRHTHARYRYAPACDAQGTLLSVGAGLDLVEHTDAAGQPRHYAYASHLLTRYTDRHGFGQNLIWDGASHKARCTRTVADDGTEDTRFTYRPELFETEVQEASGTVKVYQYTGQNLICGIETRHPDGFADYAQRLWTFDGKVAKEIDAAGNTTRFTYDERGNLAAVFSPTGATTRYEYDADNNPIKILDPSGKTWQRQYDGQGNLTAQTDPAGRVTQYAYNAQGQLTGVTDAKGGSKKLFYNDAGQLLSYTDCSGKATRFSYNRLGHLISSTDAVNNVTYYSTDALGRVTVVTRPDGSKEHLEYDAEDRPVRVTDANGKATRYGYNPQGSLTERIDANGHRLAYRYNAALQLVQLVNQNGDHYDFTYDAAGNLIQETGFDGKSTQYVYDSAGYLVESIAGQVRTEYERDGVGQLVAKHVRTPTPRGPLHLITRYRHDALGRLTAASNHEGSVLYRYDEAGNLIEEEQRIQLKAGNQKIERVFTLKHEVDELGNRIETILTNGRKLGIQRYGSGHWIGTLWNGHPLADLERDDLHRETVRQLGRQTQERLTQTKRYDALSRLSAQRLHHRHERLAGRNYFYDPVGNLTQIEDSHRDQIRYDYDPVGQLLKATQPNLIETFQFDPAGNLTDGSPQKTTLVNKAGKDHDKWEDGLDYLTEQPQGETRPTIAPVTRNLLRQYLNMTFDYDREGNTVKKIVKGGKDEQPYSLYLTYDFENRLVKVNKPKPGEVMEAEYRYDAFGRRTVKIVRKLQAAQATGTWGISDRMETVSEDITFFVWDGDVLVQEVQPHKTITYLYEPDSFVPLAQVHSDTPDSEYDPQAAQRKRASDEQRQANDEQDAENLKWLKVTDAKAYELAVKAIEERKRNERQEGFERLAYEAQNDRIYFVNVDHLGTPQEVVREDGKVVWLARYRAWGRVYRLEKNEIRQPFRFQGQYEDEETGLFYNRYRYYDPDTARYLTLDPIGLLGGDNLYRYAPNPIRWIDPLGLAKSGKWEKVGNGRIRIDPPHVENTNQQTHAHCQTKSRKQEVVVNKDGTQSHGSRGDISSLTGTEKDYLRGKGFNL